MPPLGSLTVTGPGRRDLHTLVVDDPRFEIVGGVLSLRDGVSIDGAVEPTVDVEITATDAAGAAYSETFTLQVTRDFQIQATPCTAADARLSVPVGVTYTLCENVPGASVAQLAVPDGTRSYQLSDPRFTVTEDGLLRLIDGLALDHEAEPSVPLTLTVLENGTAVTPWMSASGPRPERGAVDRRGRGLRGARRG
ncbi:MAG: hypothetical protein U5R48_08040 [Gammaproteobacteria bacterium]|nr:hypothetical protein [Gammaproteobacteria bacterium]